jgi:hypothetical protein
MDDNGTAVPEWISIASRKVVKLRIDAKCETPEDVSLKAINLIIRSDIEGAIVLLRIAGEVDGKISEILWDKIRSLILGRGAYAYSRNIYALKSKEADDNIIGYDDESASEEELIERHMDKVVGVSKENVMLLFSILSQEKREGETKNDFSSRITSEVFNALSLQNHLE